MALGPVGGEKFCKGCSGVRERSSSSSWGNAVGVGGCKIGEGHRKFGHG